MTTQYQSVAAPATTTTTQYKQVVTTRYEPIIVTKYVQVPVTRMVPADQARAMSLIAPQTPMPVPTTSLIQTPQPVVQQLPVPQPVAIPQPVAQSVVAPAPQMSMMAPQNENHYVRNVPIYDVPRASVFTSGILTNNVDDFRSRTSLIQPQTSYNPALSTSLNPAVSTTLPGINTSLNTGLNTGLTG